MTTPTDSLQEALDAAEKSNLPRWAWAMIRKACTPQRRAGEGIGEAASLDHLWTWAQSRLPLEVEPRGATVSEMRKVETVAQLRSVARWAFDYPGATQGLLAKAADGQRCALDRSAYGTVAAVVPSRGPRRPLVAFVGQAPSVIDAARGEPLSGPDGRVFADHYLTPLGLTKDDVMCTNLLPVAGDVDAEHMLEWVGWVQKELDASQPVIIVALGQAAKNELGPRADIVMPHPATLRKRRDSGEVGRKVRKLRDKIEIFKGANQKVTITKQDTLKQIVYGVTLDPYQFDSQEDWVPAWECEKTAHDYMTSSRVVNLQHGAKADAQVVESWLWPYPSDADYQAAMKNEPHKAFSSTFGTDKVHSGAWVLGVKVLDPEVWAKIESGEITAYSIGGTGIRVPVDAQTALPKVTFIDQ